MSNCRKSATDISSVERDPVFLSQKGMPGGVATLDASGKVPISQLNIAAMFTEHDPVYTADRGKPFGVPTLDGIGLVLRAQLGTGPANSTTVLFGDGTWRTPPSGGGGVDEGWLLNGPDISLETATNRVVVGSAPTIAKFGVVGDTAGDVTTIIRGATSQSADIFEIQNSVSQVLFAIGASAYFEMSDGTSAPVATANHGRQRYNNTAGNKGFEVSVDGGPWERVVADEREVERISAMLDL